MAPSNTPTMLLQASKEFPQPIHLKLARCCPTMDLVAVVTEEEQLDVYRFNGQRAFGLQRRDSESKVSSICWKYNGTYLALGWSDGAVEVISTETGNVLQQFRQVTSSVQDTVGDDSTSRAIDCIGWGMNLSRDRVTKLKARAKKNAEASTRLPFLDDWAQDNQAPSIDDLLDRMAGSQKTNLPDDLPDMLARIDAVALFPKLPVLSLLPPAAYRSGKHPAAELFSNHQSLDAALHGSTEDSYNDLDILLLSGHGGTTRLVLYDSLNIGNVDLPTAWQISKIKCLQHYSHPYSYSHMFLTKLDFGGESAHGPRIALIPLSLKFVETRGNYLQIISSKTAQLELLLQYMSECLFALQYHWNHAVDLPKRFMGLINETLADKKEDATLVQLLYHLAATGDCPPVLKEWLTDEVAERGHKRWDQSVEHGYNKVLQLMHENFLPALDRCSAVLTRIYGLVEYHKSQPDFGIEESEFSLLNEVVRSLRLLGHQVLIYGSEEHRQFQQFSKWFRHEMDVQATDPNSATAEETLEKDIGLDYGLLFSYIEGPLEKSRLGAFLEKEAEANALSSESSRYVNVKEALAAFKKGKESNLNLLGLDGRLNDLNFQCERIVTKVTKWQRESSAMTCGIVLEEGEVKAWDMRMVVRDGISTYVALGPSSNPNEVRLHRIDHVDPFTVAATGKHSVTLRFELDEVVDLKFVDDELIMFLLKSKDGSSRLLSLPYKSSLSNPNAFFSYSDFTSTVSKTQLPNGRAVSIAKVPPVVLDKENIQPYIKHTFPLTESFKPAKIEVNGRKNRRVCLVISEDGRNMKIYDLDFTAGAEEDWVDVGGGSAGRDYMMTTLGFE